MTAARACRGCRCPAEVILGAVRWSRQVPLSSRDLELLLADGAVRLGGAAQADAPAVERLDRLDQLLEGAR
jgi:hypothetical protein